MYPSRREDLLEAAVVREAMVMGVWSDKLEFVGIGMPDRIFWIPGGRPLIIEFKDPRGRLSKWQVIKIKRLRYAGYEVQVHDNYDRAMAAIHHAIMEAAPQPDAGGAVHAGASKRRTARRPRAR